MRAFLQLVTAADICRSACVLLGAEVPVKVAPLGYLESSPSSGQGVVAGRYSLRTVGAYLGYPSGGISRCSVQDVYAFGTEAVLGTAVLPLRLNWRIGVVVADISSFPLHSSIARHVTANNVHFAAGF